MKGGVKVKVYSKKFFSVIITFFLLCSCCFVAKAEVLNADDAQYSTQRYSTVESSRCGIKNSGANASMYAILQTRENTSLSITMELQKSKSGIFKTIETYETTTVGRFLDINETRLINVFATYRLKVTFTAGSETVVCYAYP